MRGAIAVRRSSLLLDREGGGENAALLLSLMSSRQLAGVEPNAHQCDVLRRIAQFAPQRIAELQPTN